jgi:hypothetical protein
MYDIKLDRDRLNAMDAPAVDASDGTHIEHMYHDTMTESEVLVAPEHTMIWNEDVCLNIARHHSISSTFPFCVT